MCHEYYCTNCGCKFSGEKIVFDLARILELGNNMIPFFVRIEPKELQSMAESSGQRWEEGNLIKLRISLKEFLNFIGNSHRNATVQNVLHEMDFEKFISEDVWSSILRDETFQNRVVEREDIRKFLDAVQTRFRFEEQQSEEGGVEDAAWEQNTEHYEAFFWIMPEFLDGDPRKLYTIKYSNQERPVQATMQRQFYIKEEIRGYCPECHAPVLREAGRMPHFLVGCIGAQAAGKTTLFLSMIKEIQDHYHDWFDMTRMPQLLADKKEKKLGKAMETLRLGWAIEKTGTGKGEGFNASVLIENEDRKAIITFVDIPGEKCIDDTGSIALNREGYSVPLVLSCHVYFFCMCVSQKGYGDKQEASITNVNLVNLITWLYNTREKINVPPMCVVITKVDMAQDMNLSSRSGDGYQRDLFSNIKVGSRKVSEQLDIVKRLYAECQVEDILSALEGCENVYLNVCRQTYVSVISCSALGMQGRRRENMEGHERGDVFAPRRLKVVWEWLLQILGLLPVIGEYSFSYIPSYEEGYRVDGDENRYSVSIAFPLEEEKQRTEGIYEVFLNHSKLDEALYKFHLGDETDGLLELLQSKIRGKKRMQMIKDYLEAFKI